MKINLFLFFTIVALSGCSDLNQQLYNYKVTQEDALTNMYGLGSNEKHSIQYIKPIDTQWIVGNRRLGNNKSIAYIPKGESMANWTQSIYEIYQPDINNSLEYYMNDSQTFIRNFCSTSHLKILSQSKHALTYLLSGKDCKDGDRISITRSFKTDDGIYWLQYFAIPGKVSEGSINAGIKAISRSKLS